MRVLILLFCLLFFVPNGVYFAEEYQTQREITLDANPEEWSDIPMYTSSDSNISKWAAVKDDTYVYFYIQLNGGNEYGLPIDNTYISIAYADGTQDRTTQIRFTGMLFLKDAFYGDIEGVTAVYGSSLEKDKYEVEVCIPQTFFANSDFVLTYCGVSLSSQDITSLYTLGEMEKEDAVYDGITIDGSFLDWDAVEKTSVDDGSIIETAVVFDGDWIYIYIKDVGNYAATYDGERSSGTYELLTDTGRRTSFKLGTTQVEGVAGALVQYSNNQYEIAIPKSELKEFRTELSFGYLYNDTPMISHITPLYGGGNITESFSGITLDGNFGDWRDYEHSLIEYSTNGALGSDADGALYIEDTTLYGHVQTYRYADEKNPYEPFTLFFNFDDEKAVSFRFITIDENGIINWNPEISYANESKAYYLVDVRGWSNASTREELEDTDYYGNKILGKAYMKRASGSDTEIEYAIDLKTLADYVSNNDGVYSFDLDETDMKTIQAYYVNIGSQRITIAGTSSGAWLGILLAVAVVGVGLFSQKRKEVCQ